MAQREILELLRKSRKPMTRQDIISSFKLNKTSVSRGLGKLVSSKQLHKETFFSGPKKYRKARYFLK